MRLIKNKSVLLLITVLLLINAALFLSSCSFNQRQTIELFGQALKKKPYDAIIIPGIPYQKGSSNDILKYRVYWSFYLYSKGIAKNIIYSGSSVYTPYNESKVMSMFAQAYGVKKDHILTETRAEHSTENLYYSWLLAKKRGFKSIALATDPAQTKMLTGYAKRLDIPVDFIPMVYSYMGKVPDVNPIIPDSLAVSGNFTPLPDRENFLRRFWGTLGMNINYKNRQ
jgi:uncharacterized SAM-binding protein YcdF (DUF218 family)